MPGFLEIVHEMSGVADAAGDAILVSPALPTGKHFRLEHIAVVDEDNSGALAKVGLRRGAQENYFETVTLTSAGVIYPSSNSVWLPSEYRLVVNVSGATSGDIIKAWVYGYLKDVEA